MNKSILIMTTLIFCSLNSWASTGKVTKVKGNNAIVQFDQPVNVGESVSTGDDLVGNADGRTAIPSFGSKASRAFAFQYNFLMTSTSQSGASSTSTLNLGGTFWFNFGQFELGPSLILANLSTGSYSTSNTTIGGYAQYDFIKNKLGVTLVPGIYGTVQLGSTTTAGASTSSTLVGIGGSIDWFPFVEHVALNVSLEYDSTSMQGGITISQLKILSGPKVYF